MRRSLPGRVFQTLVIVAVATTVVVAMTHTDPTHQIDEPRILALTPTASSNAATTPDCTGSQGHCFTLAAGSTLSQGATNVAPGDSIERLVEFSYDATVPKKSTVSLSSATAPASTSVLSLFSMLIERCPSAWTSVGTSAAPRFTCAQPVTVLNRASAVFTDAPLNNLSIDNANGKAGVVDHLRVKLVFPTSVSDIAATAGKSLTVGYTFVATGGNGNGSK